MLLGLFSFRLFCGSEFRQLVGFVFLFFMVFVFRALHMVLSAFARFKLVVRQDPFNAFSFAFRSFATNCWFER